MYVLVLFRSGPRADDLDRHTQAHREFVTSLIRRNLILCGGEFGARIDGFDAAYVLRVDSLADARTLVADDPLFAHGVAVAEPVEWLLVGINPDAVDKAAILRPTDV